MSSDSTPNQAGAAFAPHLVLGIADTATAEEARAAYLEAVRRFPPDREPARFHALRLAVRAYTEPLQVAEEMLVDRRDTPDLQAVVDEAQKRPPRPTATWGQPSPMRHRGSNWCSCGCDG